MKIFVSRQHTLSQSIACTANSQLFEYSDSSTLTLFSIFGSIRLFSSLKSLITAKWKWFWVLWRGHIDWQDSNKQKLDGIIFWQVVIVIHISLVMHVSNFDQLCMDCNKMQLIVIPDKWIGSQLRYLN